MIMARTPDGWLIIIRPENLARMKVGDPITIPDLHLMICYEDIPQDTLMKKMEGDPRPYLTRGWQNHPDDYGKVTKIGTATHEQKETTK